MHVWLRNQTSNSKELHLHWSDSCISTHNFILISGKMKTSLLGNCAEGNLHLPNSLVGAFLIFRRLAVIPASINWQNNNNNNNKVICKTYAFHENSSPHCQAKLLKTKTFIAYLTTLSLEETFSFVGNPR